jgi:predicted outer membrane repeat protein
MFTSNCLYYSLNLKGWSRVGLCLMLLIATLLPAPPVHAQTTICGSITADITWVPAGNPYIVTCDAHVVTGVSLTIQPGVIVRFDPNTALRIDGTLDARGATFTKNQSGNWKHILFTASSVDAVFDAGGAYVSGSILQDSVVEGGGANVNGAVEAQSASPLIDRNTIRVNSGGIYAVGRSTDQPVYLTRNNVSNNTKNGPGIGIYVSAGRVISNTVDSNRAASCGPYCSIGGPGGGIYAADSNLVGNLVTANWATANGGGIHATGSILLNNTVSGNTVGGYPLDTDLGGGIYSVGSTLDDNKIIGNRADDAGGGVYAKGGTLTNNTISGNTTATHGGGIYASSSRVTDNHVTDNVASQNGGGIYAAGGTVIRNMMTGNSAVGGTTLLGGGLYIVNGVAEQNTLNNNTAGSGSGIYSDNANLRKNTLIANQATTDGGGIYAFNQTTATENTLHDNTAAQGGAIFANNATITGNRIENNHANYGAGIHALASTVRGNTVLSNTTQSDGGGLYLTGGVADGNWVAANQAPGFGHGAGVYISGTVALSYNNILSNTAPGGAVGGLAVNGQPILLQYNNLYGNQPFEAEVLSTSTVSGTHNYWGTIPCTAVAGRIYDGLDAPGRGVFNYAPSLYSPAPIAQLPPVADLNIASDATSVTLTWPASPALPDVGCRNPAAPAALDLSYRVYYDTDAEGPPYNGIGLSAGVSPINVGAATQWTVNNLAPNREYHFVIAASDYLGRESAYSDEVVRPCLEEPCLTVVTGATPLVLIYAVLDNNLGDDPETWERLVNNAEKGVHDGIRVRLLVDGPAMNRRDSYLYDLQADADPGCPSLADPTCGGRYARDQNFRDWNENTAHPDTLFQFVAEALAAYPDTSQVILALVGHGSGWSANALPAQPSGWKKQDGSDYTERIGGFLWDDNPGSGAGSRSFSTYALGEALGKIKSATGRSISLLYLDACSMGGIEVAYEVRNSVDYLLASPNTDWTSFAYDAMLSQVQPNRDGATIGQAWLAAETAALQSDAYPHTLAFYDLSQIEALANASKTLKDVLVQRLPAAQAFIGQSADASERYESGDASALDRHDAYVDLYSFALSLEQDFANDSEVLAAVGQVKTAITPPLILARQLASGSPWTDPSQTWRWVNAAGLSIYLPIPTDEDKRALYTADNLAWVAATGWDQLLRAYHRSGAAQDASLSGQQQGDVLPTCHSTRQCKDVLAQPLPLEEPAPTPAPSGGVYLPIIRTE